MFTMSTVIIAICIVTAQTIHRRDTTNVQKRIIDNYLSHLQDKQLDDPAFVRILEIIAGKTNETEHCGLMGELECKLFLSTSPAVVHHQISNREVGSSFNTIMRGFVSKIVQTHFPKASKVASLSPTAGVLWAFYGVPLMTGSHYVLTATTSIQLF